jgi:hypothetical protein
VDWGTVCEELYIECVVKYSSDDTKDMRSQGQGLKVTGAEEKLG